MWVTMRGFSLAFKWMEDYKLAKDKAVKKSRKKGSEKLIK